MYSVFALLRVCVGTVTLECSLKGGDCFYLTKKGTKCHKKADRRSSCWTLEYAYSVEIIWERKIPNGNVKACLILVMI